MPNVPLTKGVATDLYAASGIAVGTKLNIQNLTCDVLNLSTTQSGLSNDYRVLMLMNEASNLASDPGAWAVSLSNTGSINVRGDA